MSKFADIAPRIWAGVATDEELSAFKSEDVFAIKSDTEHIRVRSSTVVRRVSRGDRTIEHVASDESRVKGWTLDSFQRNPQLLAEHNSFGLPLGIVVEVRKTRMGGEPKLLTTSRLHDDDKLDEHHRIRARLMLDGELPAVSVGFIPGKTMRPQSDEERKKLGVGPYGVVYESADLLELSAVTIPANPNALMRSLDALVKSGECSESLAREVAREWQPATRTVVPVAKVFDDLADPVEETPAETVIEVASGTNLEIHGALDQLTADVAELKSTLSAELAALRESIAQRSVASSPASPVEPLTEAKAADGARSSDPQAFYGAALSAPFLRYSKGRKQ
jgi:hypothetical protein